MIVQDIFLLRDTSGTVSFFVLDNSNRMNYLLISIPFFTEQSTLLIHGWQGRTPMEAVHILFVRSEVEFIFIMSIVVIRLIICSKLGIYNFSQCLLVMHTISFHALLCHIQSEYCVGPVLLMTLFENQIGLLIGQATCKYNHVKDMDGQNKLSNERQWMYMCGQSYEQNIPFWVGHLHGGCHLIHCLYVAHTASVFSEGDSRDSRAELAISMFLSFTF